MEGTVMTITSISSKIGFEELVNDYKNNELRMQMIAGEFGNTVACKVFNYLCRMYNDKPDHLANIVAGYFEFVGEDINIKNAHMPEELFEMTIKNKVSKNIDADSGKIKFKVYLDGNYAGTVWTSVLASTKEDFSNMDEPYDKETAWKNVKIIDHTREWKFGSIVHEVEYTFNGNIKFADVAIAAGYHPAGYGFTLIDSYKSANGIFTLKWKSSSSCD